jgi:hypothetical protein
LLQSLLLLLLAAAAMYVVMMMVMEEVMQRSSARANQRHRLDGYLQLPGCWRSSKTNDLHSAPGQS